MFTNSLFTWLVGLFTTRSLMLTSWSFGDVSIFLISLQLKTCAIVSQVQVTFQRMKLNRPQIEYLEDKRSCLLDLHELPLHLILEKLSPKELHAMASVCTTLRNECRNDYYWKKHLKQKWEQVLCADVYNEWKCYIAAWNQAISLSRKVNQNDWLSYILTVLPSYMRRPDSTWKCELQDSTMGLYLALENGKLWFPAQVYNRENGHAGFMLSCYDAKVRYEYTTNTFHARYSPNRQKTQEDNIEWGRLRAAVVNIPANALHISDCMSDLQPGDHIEIQWRRNKEFPYGWWYGVVGHLETCNGVEYHCHCSQNEVVVLEFKQYAQSSRWRKSIVNRITHREEGNTIDGFYGGIRKLRSDEEIERWKLLWPTKILE